MKKILFVASECVPFIKTGGLADVVGALPGALDKSRFDVRVVLPDYACIPAPLRDSLQYAGSFQMNLGSLGEQYVGIMQTVRDGVTYYLIDNQHYFSGPTPYGDLRWDIEKFCYFCKAALSILPSVGFRPDVIHCHDWQASMVPVFLHEMFLDNPFYRGIRTVVTIHNLKFQGVWDIPTFQKITGLPERVFTPGRMEFHKDANMLKGGLVYADRITTVSPPYAEEIKMPYYGEKLDGLLRSKSGDLWGILNGIDYEIYNPETDQKLYATYGKDNFRSGKAQNKRRLQQELGLPQDPDAMMIGMITRLTDQKGLDLLAYVIERLLLSRVQLAVIGTGDAKYESMLRHFEWTRKDKVSASIMFDDTRAHRLYAASDAILMPSLFEPCGLTQLIALRYGSLPIVRETGGLKDTVRPYNRYEGTGTGFSFRDYNADDMLNTIYFGEMVFYDDRRAWDAMVRRGMETDFSWNTSARRYEELYDQLS